MAGSEIGGQNFGSGVSYNRSNFGTGDFGGSFNAGDNYWNIGGAGSSVGGNQSNTGGMGGPANQSSGFSSPQSQQEQQSNFSDHMGGVSYNRSNFGSGNFGGDFNAGDKYTNIGVAGNQNNTGGFRGQSNQSSGFSSPQPQQQQQQQQQQSNVSDHMGGRGVSYNRSNFGSGNFGGNFNAGDNYTNIGGAGSSVGGNQSNTGGMGGPANQSSGFRRQRPQEHDSGHMGLHQ